MKVLIIHHLEECWEKGYKSRGTTCERLCVNAVEYIEQEAFDRIILTKFEGVKLDEVHYCTGLSDYISQVFEYAYGWEEGSISGERGDTWEYSHKHSEVVLLEDWMKELSEDDVFICGAFDGQCVTDLEDALKACKVTFNRVEHLIV